MCFIEKRHSRCLMACNWQTYAAILASITWQVSWALLLFHTLVLFVWPHATHASADEQVAATVPSSFQWWVIHLQISFSVLNLQPQMSAAQMSTIPKKLHNVKLFFFQKECWIKCWNTPATTELLTDRKVFGGAKPQVTYEYRRHLPSKSPCSY